MLQQILERVQKSTGDVSNLSFMLQFPWCKRKFTISLLCFGTQQLPWKTKGLYKHLSENLSNLIFTAVGVPFNLKSHRRTCPLLDRNEIEPFPQFVCHRFRKFYLLLLLPSLSYYPLHCIYSDWISKTWDQQLTSTLNMCFHYEKQSCLCPSNDYME